MTNGFEITYDKDKFNELKAVAYPTLDNGETQSAASGEYKMAFKTNAEGKAVAFDAADAENTNLWYHQSRLQFISKFTVTGDDSADTRPVIVKFKYKIDNTYDQNWQMSYIQVAGLKLYANKTGIGFDNSQLYPTLTALPTTSDNSHDVVMKFVPDTTENKLKLDYFLVDQTSIDVTTTARYASGGVINSIVTSGNQGSAAGIHDGPAHYVKNLEVYRGIPNITASSTTANNATGVDLEEGVVISFNDAVTLEEGAITLLKNGIEQAATVTPSEDKKSATVTLADYEEKTGYRIKVDKTKVSNALGGTLAEDFILNFVTAKELVSYTPSENMFDINNVSLTGVGSYDGSKFATVDKDVENNSFTVTVDNKSWTEAYKNKVTSGNGSNNYGAYQDSDGEYKAIGFNVVGWGGDFNNAKVNLGIKETENNGKPIYVSFDYTVTGPSGANAELHLGDTRTRPYFTRINVSDTAAYVSQAEWALSKISGNENCSTGHIEYAVYPSEGSLDGTVFKAPQWAAFNGATSINKTTYAPYDPGTVHYSLLFFTFRLEGNPKKI